MTGQEPGRGVWLWVGLLWNDRVRGVLDQYGDRITDVSIFGWEVDAAGNVRQTFDPAKLDPYRKKWPHIRFWLCFMNHGVASIFTALQQSATARANLAGQLGAVLQRAGGHGATRRHPLGDRAGPLWRRHALCLGLRIQPDPDQGSRPDLSRSGLRPAGGRGRGAVTPALPR